VNNKISQSKQSGAVSLFVVIFAALLMTIVTVSFVQLMIKDQEQATASDLSQSAYDSAQAGVEDAKRLLLAVQKCGASTDATCNKYREALASGKCSTLSDSSLVGQTNGETLIQQDAEDSNLDQAYTCVKVDTTPPNYEGGIKIHESAVVPLIGTASFNEIEVSWFSRDDVAAGTTNLRFPDSSVDRLNLPPIGTAWESDNPALLRAQLIQTSGSFDLSQFDASSGSDSNVNTLFLYPTSLPGLGPTNFFSDARRAGSASPTPVSCASTFATGEKYACKMRLTLPNPIGGNQDSRVAYLRLSALYNDTHFAVTLRDTTSGKDVDFNNVQSEVDSTGRASNLFRRVQARVELKGAMVYPEAAVDIAGNLCKNFFVTDDPDEYAPNACTP
jgi:Tfp pilus assembly protein PilX